ncbi:NUDIX domain-containing protein [Patescibacteria group bacterium]|nr:MAG: NUDIX domain-containing protein [Patescibacteria group bacterium]
MEMNYCRRCGSKLTLVHGHVYKCQNGHTIFNNASPASCLWIINDKKEVLVAIRGREPGLGKLDAPGGFCDGAETFEDSIARELLEELGLTPDNYTKPQYLLSDVNPYRYEGEDLVVLGGAFYARLIGNPVITPQDDVAEARFIAMTDVDPDMIYFNEVRASFLRLRDSGIV